MPRPSVWAPPSSTSHSISTIFGVASGPWSIRRRPDEGRSWLIEVVLGRARARAIAEGCTERHQVRVAADVHQLPKRKVGDETEEGRLEEAEQAVRGQRLQHAIDVCV